MLPPFAVLAALLHAHVPPQCGTGSFFAGTTDCGGGCSVLVIVPRSTAPDCCAACAADPRCDAWTLDATAVCRAKQGATPRPSAGSPAVSGVVARAPTPAPTQPPTPGPPLPPPPAAKNVLFIVVDDLRPNLGCYGHAFMRTPHIDALAATSLRFSRAYAQYSFCAPSRNSFMTGRRPDLTRAFNFIDHFRNTTGAAWRSLPQYFKHNGYLTMGAGKIFHPELPPAKDVPYSWSSDEVPYVSPDGCVGASVGNSGIDCVPSWQGCANASNASTLVAGDAKHWCSVNVSEVRRAAPAYGQRPLADMKIADATIAQLRRGAAANSGADGGGGGRPFFVAMGLHKPHLPFAAPSEFHDMQLPLSQIAPPRHDKVPRGSPAAAWHPGGFGEPACTYNTSVPPEQAAVYRRAYYAAVSYTDSLVGEALAELAALGLENSTVVCFLGDHGWQLGEMDEWRKMTNWELGVRIPLLIRSPAHAATAAGVATPALAEAVDLYPTLAALAGLPPPASQGESSLQGTDLSPLFAAPPANGTGPLKLYAFSQFGKGNTMHAGKLEPWNTCTKCDVHQGFDYFGYSLRDDRWRYTEWVAWNHSAARPLWGQYGAGGGVELYDHEGDYGADMDAASETVNLAADGGCDSAAGGQYGQLCARFSQALHEQFDNDLPPPN